MSTARPDAGTLAAEKPQSDAAPRGPVDPRLWRRTAAVRRYLLAAVVVGTLTAALVVVQAWLLAHGIAGVVTDGDVASARSAAVGLAVVVAARAGLVWLNGVLGRRAAASVKSRLRQDAVRARLTAPDAPGTAAGLVTTVTSGLDALDGYVARYLPALALAATVPLVVGVAVLAADGLSALVVVLTVPLVPLFMVLVGWLTRRLVQRRARVQSRLGHHFADLVAGLPTLQVFGRARAQVAGLRASGERHRVQTLAVLRVSFLSALVLELLASLSVAVVAVTVGLRVVEGRLDLATALFVLVLAPEVYFPLRQVGAHYHDSADGVAAAERVFALLDRAPAARAGSAPLPSLALHPVRLEQVRVRYPGADHDALAPLDLQLSPGEVVALTGSSGSGKSTALQVLLGLRAPTSGRVRVGPTPLDVVHGEAWRHQVAWVPQRPTLLAGTVADNVALGLGGTGALPGVSGGRAAGPAGAPGASHARLRVALDAAGGAGLSLEQPVGPAGEGLSAGEQRRVALARALLKVREGGARLLLVDEPTAGLDAQTELTAVAGLRRSGATVLVVSHRPAVLAAVDRVVTIGAALADGAAAPSPLPARSAA